MVKKWARKLGKSFFVVCNFIVAFLFILSCYGGRIDHWHWILGLIILNSFFLFLILVAFIFMWLIARSWFALIGFVSILVCLVPALHVLRFRTTGDFNLEKKESDIRVMSWNVEFFNLLFHLSKPGNKNKMIYFVKKMNPDIICLQEMSASDSDPKAINYMPDIVGKMGDYEYRYTYNPSHNFDKTHHFGIAILSKYHIVRAETISLDKNKYNSTFLYVDVVKNNDTFRVFNIHLQTLNFDKKNRSYLDGNPENNSSYVINSKSILHKFKIGFSERKKQSDFVKRQIDASPYPVILCGDFNDVPNSYAYYTIGNGMKNAFAEKGVGLGATFNGISPTLRIDNIFCSPSFDVLQYDRFKSDLSDHFPIVADLSFNKKN